MLFLMTSDYEFDANGFDACGAPLQSEVEMTSPTGVPDVRRLTGRPFLHDDVLCSMEGVFLSRPPVRRTSFSRLCRGLRLLAIAL